jgi:hypothetical protein
MSTSSDRPGRDPYPATTPADQTVPPSGGPVSDERSTAADPVVDRDGDGIDDRREIADRDRDGIDDRQEVDRRLVDRNEVIAREREAFGGVKVGSAFFGWLTATGTAVILTALLAATGAALGLGIVESDTTVAGAALDTETVGWVGAIALLVILFLAYYCGGYVAGRMARFNGILQGIAVWVWALVIAIVVALVSVVVGSQFDILGELNAFPRFPVAEGDLTVAGIITTIVVIIASLGGAILGGKAGTHYHRKVDRAGYTVER